MSAPVHIDISKWGRFFIGPSELAPPSTWRDMAEAASGGEGFFVLDVEEPNTRRLLTIHLAPHHTPQHGVAYAGPLAFDVSSGFLRLICQERNDGTRVQVPPGRYQVRLVKLFADGKQRYRTIRRNIERHGLREAWGNPILPPEAGLLVGATFFGVLVTAAVGTPLLLPLCLATLTILVANSIYKNRRGPTARRNEVRRIAQSLPNYRLELVPAAEDMRLRPHLGVLHPPTFQRHVDIVNGKSSYDYDACVGLLDPTRYVPRLHVNHSLAVTQATIQSFCEETAVSPERSKIRELVIGTWGGAHTCDDIIEFLAQEFEARAQLTHLRISTLSKTRSGISKIPPYDLTPLLEQTHDLQHLHVVGPATIPRGCIAQLRSLTIETVDITPRSIEALAAEPRPNLKRLELWLGSTGKAHRPHPVAALLCPNLLPSLRHLAIRNAARADDIVVELLRSGLVDQLDSLDLSFGTLTDRGAHALLRSPGIARLATLDLRHHYLSEETARELETLGPQTFLRWPRDPSGDLQVALRE